MAILFSNGFSNLFQYVQTYPKLSFGAVIALLVIGSLFYERMGFYVWYLGVIALGGVIAFGFDATLYFYTFLLGVATAFAEVISKFSDEPLKSLKTPHALIYHLMNGLVAVFALRVLFVFLGTPAPSDLQTQMKYVLSAGLGSMVLMRSKLFNIKIDDQDVSFGPEQIVKIYFNFMEAAIDRVRAKSRIDFVRERMRNICFDAVYDYAITMLQAPQAWDKDRRAKARKDLEAVKRTQKISQLKSYDLGFILLNNMGENFLTELFIDKDTRQEWWIQAPPEKKDESKIVVERGSKFAVLPFVGTREERKGYLAYGSSMSSNEFRKRLNWATKSSEEFEEETSPAKATLKGFKLTFNKPIAINGAELGLGNLTPDPSDEVKGVVYYLTQDQISFLNRDEAEYQLVPVKVTLDANGSNAKPQEVEAVTYVAKSTRDNLAPNPADLDLAIAGAIERGLDQDYVRKLESLKPGGGVK